MHAVENLYAVDAPRYDDQGNIVDNPCPFCRTPRHTSNKELNERYKKRMELNDAQAFFNMGCWHKEGRNGHPQNMNKALEHCHRAGELGFAESYNNIGYAYRYGEGVVVDENKAKHYYELAAMGGSIPARTILGIFEENRSNWIRALKHHMVAVEGGSSPALEQIKVLYKKGQATKDDYTKALQSYQAYLGEIKSVQRDEAAAAYENYHYY